MSTETRQDKYKLDRLAMHWAGTSKPSNLTIASIAKVDEAFHRNIQRIESLATFPPYLIGKAYELERLQCTAEAKALGEVQPYLGGEIPTTEQSQRLATTYEEVKRKYLSETEVSQRFSANHELGILFISEVLQFPEAAILTAGIESYIASITLGAWTAFEVMAGDLWEAALNEHPKDLARLTTGKAQIDLEELQRHKFNLSGKMGTVLRDRYKFISLDGIREAYKSAFVNVYKPILELVRHECFYHLSQIRNVLVHKAGIVDDEFHAKMESHPTLKDVPVGAAIPLDGLIVADLVQDVVRQSKNLIVQVEAWLLANPQQLPA